MEVEEYLRNNPYRRKSKCNIRKYAQLIILAFFGIVVIVTLFIIFLVMKKEKEIKGEPDLEYSDQIPMDLWGYNKEDKVYYYVKIKYVKNADNHQKFSIYIPEEYMDCTRRQNTRYRCQIKSEVKSNITGYTPSDAPIVFTIETPGYLPCPAPTKYDSVDKMFKKFTEAGMIFIYPGLRGSLHGAPLGVVDLKAMVTYIKNQTDIPGDINRIFSMGMGGGGAQSSLMGVSGNSKIFDDYLHELGVENGNNDILGSMCWCPTTSLDTANEAYEWNMGITRRGLNETMQKVSENLAKEYKDYINKMKFKDENGNILELTESSDNNYYLNGSYHDYIKREIEHSFDNWIGDTAFPIISFYPELRIFYSLEEYLTFLNHMGSVWITVDSDTNLTSITDVESFVKNKKHAEKGIGAFDAANLTNYTSENILFGLPNPEDIYNPTVLHFDEILGKILNKEEEFKKDMSQNDMMGHNVSYRLKMYSPLNYIYADKNSDYSSQIAKYWRIRSGMFQTETSLCTEINLKLGLLNNGIEDIDFETVWGFYHELAERGDKSPYLEFIAWINTILKAQNIQE